MSDSARLQRPGTRADGGFPSPSRFTGNTVCVSLTAHTCRLRNLTGNPVCPRGAPAQRYVTRRRSGSVPVDATVLSPRRHGLILPTMADLRSRRWPTSILHDGRPPLSTTPNGENRNVFHRKRGVRLTPLDTGRRLAYLPSPTVSFCRRRARPPPTPSASFTGNPVSDRHGTRRSAAFGRRARAGSHFLRLSELLLVESKFVFSSCSSEINNIHKRLLYSVDNLYTVW
jgi:hypothetical protein